MSLRAALNSAYTLLARRADAADEKARMFGKPDDPDPTSRRDLDAALGLLDDIGDESSATNVVELRAFVDRVNATMR